MNRRGFIQGLAGIAGAIGFPVVGVTKVLPVAPVAPVAEIANSAGIIESARDRKSKILAAAMPIEILGNFNT